MNNKDKYIVFDWDGTLHNTQKLYAESVRKAYSFLADAAGCKEDKCIDGFLEKTPEELSERNLSKYLGMTAAAMWADFMPELEEDIRAKAEKLVGDSMVELVYNNSAVLYDGVTEMFDILREKGFKLLILSNCKVAYLEAHKKVFKLDRWFTDYFPAQAYDFIPKEDILKLAMDKYPGEYVMVGDRQLDIVAGAVCGAKTIGCLYGFGTSLELEKADFLAESVEDIIRYVCLLSM